MVTVTKTYTNLADQPDVSIEACSAILPNHMQCWRAADVLVTVVTRTITPAHDEVAEDITETVSQYQLCRRHAQIDEDRYILDRAAGAAAAAEAATVAAAAEAATVAAAAKEETADAKSSSNSAKSKS
jgi:hypothetical protein